MMKKVNKNQLDIMKFKHNEVITERMFWFGQKFAEHRCEYYIIFHVIPGTKVRKINIIC